MGNNSLHGGPLPPHTPLNHPKSPSQCKSAIKDKNIILLNVPFHSYPLKSIWDRYPDASPCILIAPDILHIFIKFQS